MKERTISATITLPGGAAGGAIGVPGGGSACGHGGEARGGMHQEPGGADYQLQPHHHHGHAGGWRLKSACEGTRVDVRSLADYIENRGEMDHAARMRRKGYKHYV